MAFWLALESNPEVLNDYMIALGVPKEYQLVDVFSLEEDFLHFIPQPVYALILLFPDSEKILNIEQDSSGLKDLFFIKQTMQSNACGTISLIHSILNNPNIPLNNGALKSFYDKSINLSPETRGRLLEESSDFLSCHQAHARLGQSNGPTEDEVEFHFISFIHKNGSLYEMDGGKSGPILHQNTTAENFLHDAAKILKKLMCQNSMEIRFSVLALIKNV